MGCEEATVETRRRPRVLVLSRDYPNCELGALIHHSTSFCEPKVVAPVPYRGHPQVSSKDDVEVFHPRYMTAESEFLNALGWVMYDLTSRRQIKNLRRVWPFDLIHAHCINPDGCLAARLGGRYRVPVIITEHEDWTPQMERNPKLRRRSIQAARECTFQVAISAAIRESIACYAGESEKLRVIPEPVNCSIFRPPGKGHPRIENQILCVGLWGTRKGEDLLLRAMRLLLDLGRAGKLVLVCETENSGRRNQNQIHQTIRELNVEGQVRCVSIENVAGLVTYLQESAVLVLPSRTGHSRAIPKALACGTPVVAIRCDGPEDIVDRQTGVLVVPENPDALAHGIECVLDRRADLDPEDLRASALKNFGVEAVGLRVAELYAEAIERYSWRTNLVTSPT